MSLDINKAQEELKTKTYKDIQKQTAWTWASRAAASYLAVVGETVTMNKVLLVQVAEEYYHEAVEHAALYDDDGSLLKEINEIIKHLRFTALKIMQSAIENRL